MADHLAVESPAQTVSSCVDAIASLSLQGVSPLERLPTELLRQILEDVLPQMLVVSFTRYCTPKMWRPKTRVAVSNTSNSEVIRLAPYVSLLKTCRKVSREARAMLYGNNQFEFCTDLPLPNERLTKIPYHALCDMRDVQLLIEGTQRAAEHESFLERFVHVINAHSGDGTKNAVLQRLKVKIEVQDRLEDYSSHLEYTQEYSIRQAAKLRFIDRCMHTLEVLSKLPKVGSVKVEGPPLWLSRCLEICIQGGHGVDVPVLYWRMKKVRKTKNHAAYHKSTRTAEQPILDWSNFAQKHDIAVPERYIKFYAQHNG